MSDPDKLEHIASELRQVATQYDNAAQTLYQQAHQLDWQAQDLVVGVDKWAGKSSQAFLTSWSQYHADTLRSSDSLTQTAQKFKKLAKTIDDNVQAIRDAQNQVAMGVIITGGLILLDVVQLGLDPVTDGATVVSAGADAELVQQAQAAEETIVTMDTEISAELEQITTEIENSSELTSITTDTLSNDASLPISDGTTTEFFQQSLNADNPGGSTITSVGESYIQKLKDMGIEVSNDPDTQAYLRSQGNARASTWFNGIEGDAGPGTTTVLLGSNANNAAVYEEYLHVLNGEARGWMGLTEPQSIQEEIQVETQVLNNADQLGMTAAEQKELQQLIDNYRTKLWDNYGLKAP